MAGLFNIAETGQRVQAWFSANVTNLNGTLDPGQYYLVQLGSGGGVSNSLPTTNRRYWYDRYRSALMEK